jgi:large subunit ribosomal protein L9
MQVILLKDVQNVGKKDEVKEVTAGYASNFLMPQKLAIKATAPELEKLRKKSEIESEKLRKREEQLKEVAKKFDGLQLEIEEKADEQGTLYGGVDKKRIAELLKMKGFDIESEKINLFSHLKKIGEHEIEINILPSLKVKIKLNIKASA